MATTVEAAQARFDLLFMQQRALVEGNAYVGEAEQQAMGAQLKSAERDLDEAKAHMIAPAPAMPPPAPMPPPPPPRPVPDLDKQVSRLVKMLRKDIATDKECPPVVGHLLEHYDALAQHETPIVSFLLASFIATNRRVKALEARAKELEANQLRFCGVWEARVYAANALVQRQGGLWLALRGTGDMPPSPDWRLIVKRGSLKED